MTTPRTKAQKRQSDAVQQTLARPIQGLLARHSVDRDTRQRLADDLLEAIDNTLPTTGLVAGMGKGRILAALRYQQYLRSHDRAEAAALTQALHNLVSALDQGPQRPPRVETAVAEARQVLRVRKVRAEPRRAAPAQPADKQGL